MNDNPVMRLLYPLFASVAGAITALSFRPFQSMSRGEILMALAVGTFFAVFVGPWVASRLFGSGPVDIRILGGVYYLMASGSNILIPLAVRWLGKMFGVKSEETSR